MVSTRPQGALFDFEPAFPQENSARTARPDSGCTDCQPYGFTREKSPEIFAIGKGRTPLRVALDTNIVETFAQRGARILERSLAATPLAIADLEAATTKKLRAPLQDAALAMLIQVWCFRDIRFIIYESQLEDFRAGSSLSDDQWHDRVQALERLEVIVEEAERLFVPGGLKTCGTCGRCIGVSLTARALADWEEDTLDRSFARQRSFREVPTLDEVRVRDALRQQADVLLTNDHQLSRRLRGRLPLSLMRPTDFVQALYVSKELGPGRFNLSEEVLALPAQDPHKLIHLLGLLRDRV